MRLKTIKDEVFNDFIVPGMLICAPSCSFKCATEEGKDPSICQNYCWEKEPTYIIDDNEIINRYLSNPITRVIIFGGLEPFDNFSEIINFIEKFRQKTNDFIIIYSGYEQFEIKSKLQKLKEFENIIVKFGRYKSDLDPIYDDVLKITLASSNQYAIYMEDYNDN